MSFETEMEFYGAIYKAIVEWDWIDDEIDIQSVSITRGIKHYYNAQGEYKPRIEIIKLDMISMMDDEQMGAIISEIRDAEQAKAEEEMTPRWRRVAA